MTIDSIYINKVVNNFYGEKKRKFLGLLNLQIFPNPTNLLVYDAVVYLKSFNTMGYVLHALIPDLTESRKWFFRFDLR